MRLHVSHKKKYVLQTFPKSGCSSLQTMFEYLERDDYSPRQLHLWPQDCDECQLQLQHQLDISAVTHNLSNAGDVVKFDFNAFDDYFIFSVVRNTYDRVVSMYFNIFLLIESKQSMLDGVFLGKHHLVKRPKPVHHSGVGQYNPAGRSFNWFLKWLGDHNLNVTGDAHWNIQYLFEPSFFRVDKYINLDKINEVLPELYETRFSISKDKVKKILKNKENVLPKNNYDIDIKLDNYNFEEDSLNLDIIKNGIPQKELMLTDESIEIIYKLYKEEIDYHKFKVN